MKKETPTQMFSWEFCKILGTPFFIEHLRWLLLTCVNCTYALVGGSGVFNIAIARHEQRECDTSDMSATRATRMLHERHKCDTSERF